MKRPTIVCLCGSTRFKEAFEEAQLQESLAGKIVLTVAGYPHHDGGRVRDMIFGRPGVKELLDELHFRKIDLADEVYILNVDGYIGESTRGELAYAQSQGKKIRYLEDPRLDHEIKGKTTSECTHTGLSSGLSFHEFLGAGVGLAEARDEAGDTLLHRVLCEQEGLEKARFLIMKGADVNAENNLGNTPLHIVCIVGNTDIARLLLEHGANPNAKDKKWRTPLHRVLEIPEGNHGREEIIDLFREHCPEAVMEVFCAMEVRP